MVIGKFGALYIQIYSLKAKLNLGLPSQLAVYSAQNIACAPYAQIFINLPFILLKIFLLPSRNLLRGGQHWITTFLITFSNESIYLTRRQ